MQRLRDLLSTVLDSGLNSIVISHTRVKDNPVRKIKYRPVVIKGNIVFQETKTNGTQEFHKNLEKSEALEMILEMLEKDYVQIEVNHSSLNATGLINKKGGLALKIKNKTITQSENTVSLSDSYLNRLSHNKKKKYIIEEGVAVPFLVDLGVMTKDGRIVNKRYDKFRQINRFLEFVEDIVTELPRDREISIIDFGCGKSYLTFALYYYLKVLQGVDIRITGLDLKETVIDNCNELSKKYGYDKLEFLCGDIATYDKTNSVDMVVTLHACDTATDYALYKAVNWGAKVILSVPCCQHEMNGQIQSDLLNPVLKYGLIKERMSALITDAVRGEILRLKGYEVQILEFIDMEHTPKNILLRCVYKGEASDEINQKNNLTELMKELNVTPTLYKLMFEG